MALSFFLAPYIGQVISFPGVAQMVKCLPTMRETRVQSLVGKISWRRKWQPTPVFLPGKSHGQRSLVGYTLHGVAKSQTRLSDFTFTFSPHKFSFVKCGWWEYPSQRVLGELNEWTHVRCLEFCWMFGKCLH